MIQLQNLLELKEAGGFSPPSFSSSRSNESTTILSDPLSVIRHSRVDAMDCGPSLTPDNLRRNATNLIRLHPQIAVSVMMDDARFYLSRRGCIAV
jgi:hypothetical protein